MIQTCDINVKTTSLCSSWRVISQVHQQHIWSTWSTVYIFSHKPPWILLRFPAKHVIFTPIAWDRFHGTSGKKRFKTLLAVLTPLALHSGEWQWLVIHIPRKKGKYMHIYIYSEKAWPKYSIWNSLSFQVKHWLNKRIALHSAHQKRIWTTYNSTTCTLTRQNSCLSHEKIWISHTQISSKPSWDLQAA